MTILSLLSCVHIHKCAIATDGTTDILRRDPIQQKNLEEENRQLREEINSLKERGTEKKHTLFKKVIPTFATFACGGVATFVAGVIWFYRNINYSGNPPPLFHYERDCWRKAPPLSRAGRAGIALSLLTIGAANYHSYSKELPILTNAESE